MKQSYKEIITKLEQSYAAIYGEQRYDKGQTEAYDQMLSQYQKTIQNLKEIDQRTDDEYDLSAQELAGLGQQVKASMLAFNAYVTAAYPERDSADMQQEANGQQEGVNGQEEADAHEEAENALQSAMNDLSSLGVEYERRQQELRIQITLPDDGSQPVISNLDAPEIPVPEEGQQEPPQEEMQAEANEAQKQQQKGSPSAAILMSLDGKHSQLENNREQVPEELRADYDAFSQSIYELEKEVEDLARQPEEYQWSKADLDRILEKTAQASLALEKAQEHANALGDKNTDALLTDGLKDAMAPLATEYNKRISDLKLPLQELEPATADRAKDIRQSMEQAPEEVQPEVKSPLEIAQLMQEQHTKLMENRKNVPPGLLGAYDEYVMAYREAQFSMMLGGNGEWTENRLDSVLQPTVGIELAYGNYMAQAQAMGEDGAIATQMVRESVQPVVSDLVTSYDQRVKELGLDRKPMQETLTEMADAQAAQQMQQPVQQAPEQAQPVRQEPQPQPVRQAPEQAQPAGEAEQAEKSALDVKATKLASMKIRDELIDATKGVHLGSKEYDRAYDAFNVVNADWITLDAQHKDGADLTENDLRRLRTKLLDAKASIDAYIERKETQGESKWGEKDKKRVNAMRHAMETLEAQEALLAQRQAEIENAPAPSHEDIHLRADSILHDMEDAEKNVYFGSKEYTAAQVAFSKLNDRWREIHEKGPDYEMTAEEIQELRELSSTYETAADAYLMTKEGKDLKAKTQTRVDAIWAGKDAVRRQLKRLEENQKILDNKPAKSMSTLIQEGDACAEALQEATVGVHGGSKEFRNAMELYHKNVELMKKLNGDEHDHKLSARERGEYLKQLEETSAAIEKYLAMKKDKKLGPKTQKRVDAMKKAKESIADQKKKLEERRKEMQKDTRSLDPTALDQGNTSTQKELTAANKRVWRGSKQYNDALKSHEHCTHVMREYYNGGVPDAAKSEHALEELRKTQKSIAVYLDYKGDEKLNAKGERRREAMRRAYDEVTRQIDRIEDQLAQNKEQKKETAKQELKNGVKRYENRVKQMKGKERLMAGAAAEAAKGLEALSAKKELSPADKQKARYAMAALVLQEKLLGPGGDKFAKSLPTNSKQMADAIMKVANSPEFKAAFPDSELTPEKCSKMVSDPKQVRNALQSFTNKTREMANMTKKQILAKEKELEMENAKRKLKPAM